jgi:predicted metal-dependent HD superfamily phosphohydrolase
MHYRRRDSYRYFAKQVKLNGTLSRKVGAYILATKKHDVSASLDRDLRLFVDLDMAVLGRQPRTGSGSYAEYAGRIRREYAHVSDADYCTTRAAFLAAVSKDRSKPLYATSAYRASHEEAARANILWETDELLAGRIPGQEGKSGADGTRRKE